MLKQLWNAFNVSVLLLKRFSVLSHVPCSGPNTTSLSTQNGGCFSALFPVYANCAKSGNRINGQGELGVPIATVRPRKRNFAFRWRVGSTNEIQYCRRWTKRVFTINRVNQSSSKSPKSRRHAVIQITNRFRRPIKAVQHSARAREYATSNEYRNEPVTQKSGKALH